MIQKLTNYASIIGVIGAIGGGFYAWGEFNTRLDSIENKEFVVNETVDLAPVNEKINGVQVEILLGEELNTYLVSHGWTHPLLEKIEVIKEDNISRLEWRTAWTLFGFTYVETEKFGLLSEGAV